jgi:hypothetical protein
MSVLAAGHEDLPAITGLGHYDSLGTAIFRIAAESCGRVTPPQRNCHNQTKSISKSFDFMI